VDPSAHVPALLVLAEAAAALLVAITAAIAPGYAAARVRPAAVLRTE
jgi:ABC-type lipoprotein release transport system permease subunit